MPSHSRLSPTGAAPEIRPYRTGDEAAILDLYEECFGQRQSLAQWHWRFRDVPHGEPRIHLAWVGGRCVGQFAYSPMPLAIDGEPFEALVALDGMVRREYRGSGLFSDLEQSVAESIPDGVARYGFPNDRSYPLFVGPLGWGSPGAPQVWMKLLGTESLATSRGRLLHLAEPVATFGRWRDRSARGQVACRQFSRFVEIEGALSGLDAGGIRIRRDPAVLDWRYRQGPHPYRLFAFGSPGAEAGFAVVRLQEKFGLRIAWLAEFTASADPRLATAQLRALASELHGEADLLSALLPHDSQRSLLRRAGFYEAPRRVLPHPFFFITRGTSRHQAAFDAIDRWSMSWGLHDAV